MAKKIGLCLVLLSLACAGTTQAASAKSSDHASSRTIPMSIRIFRFDNEIYLKATIRNPYSRALCIDIGYVPGRDEITEGPTHILDASGAEVNRKRQEDILARYPTGMDGRVVLIIPPKRVWFDDYSLSKIFDLHEDGKYFAIVKTFGLFCGIYEKGTPGEIEENEYEKYEVLITSNKAEFHTGKIGAD